MEKLLGERLYSLIYDWDSVLEIRLRLSEKTLIKRIKNSFFCDFIPNSAYFEQFLLRAMKFSPYAYEQEISSGFIHYNKGVRIGLCGRGKVLPNQKLSVSPVTSLCIRIPHEVEGCSDQLGNFYQFYENTLIVSPPFCGKTTLIRDMARRLSERYDTLYIDEREELCGGELKKGCRADILSGVPKKTVYENIIRTMAPQIVVCDELFSNEDFDAVNNFDRAGIKCLASFHANEYENIPVLLKNVFCKFVFLSNTPTMGTIRSIRRRDD